MQHKIIAIGGLSVSEQPANSTTTSNARTLLFMVILSFICALILSLLASALAQPKLRAKELDRSQQMMIASKILDHEGRFILQGEGDKTIFAKFSGDGNLEPSAEADFASQGEILKVYDKRLQPFLVDSSGKLFTFKEADLDEDKYLSEFKKIGYYKAPYKLIYKILPNADERKDPPAEGWVIPVNGLGLWDAIYGYLAIKPDAATVIGITWYDQKETPGLGANIADAPWQSQFPGKKIFQESADGKIDFKTAPIGIVVVRGKVSEVYGDSPKAKSAVDGMAGATLTGNGVTDAYRDVLDAYRPFLIRIHEEQGNKVQAQVTERKVSNV